MYNYDVNIRIEAEILIETIIERVVEHQTGKEMMIQHRTSATIREEILRKRIEELS